MTAMCSPVLTPAWARPHASQCTSSRTWPQVQLCQVPRSFSRIAASAPRTWAWRSRSFGNVSGVPGCADMAIRSSSLFESILPRALRSGARPGSWREAGHNSRIPSQAPARLKLLEGIRVVTMALNLPGPLACARLRELGAAVTKVEPPAGDPFERFCPGWYRRLHHGLEVVSLDLKSDPGREAFGGMLDDADLLVTAQRASALARLRLDPGQLARSHPRLCHVAITGLAAPHDEVPGHDLTYLAAEGLVSPPELPRTLYADVSGAERAVSIALALLVSRLRSGKGAAAQAPLADAASALSQPLHEGLTRPGALLGGGAAGYNLYAARDGWVAVAALEPHFAKALAEKLQLRELTAEALGRHFATRDARYWEDWARVHDLPIVAVRDPQSTTSR